MEIPAGVSDVLEALTRHGHQAYVVGGCVRDALLGAVPGDWDVCTSALPGEVQRVFAGSRVIPTGLKHGTVTVLAGLPVEVTTFRTEGAYTDGRRPDSVTFVRNLEDDLARRDFTVNAIAFHPQTGYIDPFGGMDDLQAKRIRCVGDADARLTEDALRIVRALRFASVLGFKVESRTADALHRHCGLLRNIAAERIRAELGKLLCGDAVMQAAEAFSGVLCAIIPEMRPAIGFAQHNPHHCYDVFMHTLHAVSHVKPTETLRLTMLLHDLGKPATLTLDEAGVGHFPGHEQRGAAIADGILRRLAYDNATKTRVLTLISLHDEAIGPEETLVKRMLRQLGVEAFEQLWEVKRADALAHHPGYRARQLEILSGTKAALERVLASRACFEMSSLAIDGAELLALGIRQGPEVGRILDHLLSLVIEDRLPNEKERLLAAARDMMNQPL